MEYDPQNWKDGAKCAGMDPGLFESAAVTNKGIPEKAAQACADCDVSDLCRDYALDNHFEEGIWGGRNFGNKQVVMALRQQLGRIRRKAS